MSAENTTTNIQYSTGTENNVSEADAQRQPDFQKQQEKKEIQMAEVDTQMLAGQHADIRREVAIAAGDVNRNVSFEGQESVMATKDARHDIIQSNDTSADRIVDRVTEGSRDAAAQFFTVARDTADLRAQVIQAIDTTKLATELNALRGIIEGQKNTTYLSDKITQEGEKTRDLISNLKYHDLNRDLIERNAILAEERWGHRHWRGAFEQNQFAAVTSQIQALNSQFQTSRQGMVNFGTQAGVGQTSTTNQA